jgi:hypothetical protein
MLFRQTPRLVRAILVAFLAFAGGCGSSGPPIVSVSGKVTLDGMPLTEGVISFISKSGHVSSAPIASDGTFQLVSQYGKGIPLDGYSVSILPRQELDPTKISMAGNTVKTNSRLPMKYQNPAISGLTANVNGSSSKFTFNLLSAP